MRPTWSFSFEVVIRYLRLDWEATEQWDLARLRADVNGRPYPAPYVKKVEVRDETIGGVPVRSFRRPTDRREGAIVFFHGGSCVYGSAKTSHADLMARLALETGVEVFGVEYRLAPEHPYPAQRDDGLAVWRALGERGIARDRMIVAGDSAGGNVAVAVALALAPDERPSAMALLSPWCDLEMKGASFVENAEYEFGTREGLVRHAAAFAGAIPVADPRISLVHADLAGLPPALVQWGTCEVNRDDIISFADALERAGVTVTRSPAEDMVHNPAFFAQYHPSGEAAFQAVAKFVRERLA